MIEIITLKTIKDFSPEVLAVQVTEGNQGHSLTIRHLKEEAFSLSRCLVAQRMHHLRYQMVQFWGDEIIIPHPSKPDRVIWGRKEDGEWSFFGHECGMEEIPPRRR